MKILIAAGEKSGDLHAARLMAALRKATLEPVEFRGMGGDLMERAGARLLFRDDDLAVIGFVPVLAKLPFFLHVWSEMKRLIRDWHPDLVVTIDYPGFNLRLDASARRRHIPTVHVVCPQVWAWRRGRIPKIAASMDRLLCFFPFEPALFAAMSDDPASGPRSLGASEPSFRAVFVGHPLVDIFREEPPPGNLPWFRGTKRVALLPGSRAGEIDRILPRLLAAAKLLEKKLGEDHVSFLIPAATSRARVDIVARLDMSEVRPCHIACVAGRAREVLRSADAAAVASGTATLEAALARVPTVLVYAVSPALAAFARLVIRGVKFLGLANIVAGREVMPELLQQDFTPEATAARLEHWLADPAAHDATVAELDAATAKLVTGHDAMAAAAHEIFALLAERTAPGLHA